MRQVFTIRSCSPLDEKVSTMIDALDAYQSSLYPAESNHLDSRQTLSEPNCKFLGAYLNDQLVGIGAAKRCGEYGELKRFFVPQEMRGKGIAELLIATLELWLVENGVYQCFLETGIHQHAAIKLYSRLGYSLTEPFGSYQPDPLSVFMRKDLSKLEYRKGATARPIYLVAFASHLESQSPEYHTVGEKMVQLARAQNGFLGMCSTRNTDGHGFTASYWQNMESISEWGRHPEHAAAQKLGREEFYKSYRISLAKVE